MIKLLKVCPTKNWGHFLLYWDCIWMATQQLQDKEPYSLVYWCSSYSLVVLTKRVKVKSWPCSCLPGKVDLDSWSPGAEIDQILTLCLLSRMVSQNLRKFWEWFRYSRKTFAGKRLWWRQFIKLISPHEWNFWTRFKLQ